YSSCNFVIGTKVLVGILAVRKDLPAEDSEGPYVRLLGADPVPHRLRCQPFDRELLILVELDFRVARRQLTSEPEAVPCRNVAVDDVVLVNMGETRSSSQTHVQLAPWAPLDLLQIVLQCTICRELHYDHQRLLTNGYTLKFENI
uniref:Uncharacterized protein n=1 Tax=Meloidogyne incognita TaxID=6306 RepID=A0A914NSC1_MELIC